MTNTFTCLLVDDDEDDLEIFEIALNDTGESYQCITAANGVDALQKLEKEEAFTPDFIFLDLNMPVMNGVECLREIKKNVRLRDIPVIIYSTSSYIKDIEEMKRLGAAHFFTKPSSIDALSKILLALFQKESLPFSLSHED